MRGDTEGETNGGQKEGKRDRGTYQLTTRSYSLSLIKQPRQPEAGQLLEGPPRVSAERPRSREHPFSREVMTVA